MGSKVACDAPWSNEDDSVQRVAQVALDVHEAEKPSLIKIDTQGYIYQPLLGLKSIIDTRRPKPCSRNLTQKAKLIVYGENFERIFERL